MKAKFEVKRVVFEAVADRIDHNEWDVAVRYNGDARKGKLVIEATHPDLYKRALEVVVEEICR